MKIRRRLTEPGTGYEIAPRQSTPDNILEKIIWQKEQEVLQMLQAMSSLKSGSDYETLLKPSSAFSKGRDFAKALKQGSPALIAEVKKASPSKGIICPNFDPVKIAQAYERGGAACLSVLTDETFFQGSFENLRSLRDSVSLPLLCKEFIIDACQVITARAAGADAVLLIAAVLTDADLSKLSILAYRLGMDSLVEVHTLAELDRVLALPETGKSIKLVGINNRNLEDFSVNLATTEKLLEARGEALRAKDIVVVSESGLKTASDLIRVNQAGANAVLVGESLVTHADIAGAVQAIIPKLELQR
ncbi:MAG: indole-3-glycerol phosphate synthase TrpC [Limnoraphis sp. WC205]|jgi:indole-3-glycerol phosphate synthase|nr:indole-3-glycerol phosphate synthase TrpC [Limnoraphis sp. WC205]